MINTFTSDDRKGFAGPPMARRLAWLLGARIGLTILVFVLSLSTLGVEGQIGSEAYDGLYYTVAASFLVTAVYGAIFRYIRRLGLFAVIQIATDLLIVSSLVHFSGGRESFFGFLYLPVTIFGAVLFPRIGAIGIASAGAAAYGALLLLERSGGLVDFAASPPPPEYVIALLWSGNAGAMFLVAFLASHLTRELVRTGDALAQRTSDLHRLRNIHERTVESLVSGLLTTGPRGRITSFNREAERITGVRVRDAIGIFIDDVIPGCSEAVLAPTDAAAGKSSRLRMEFVNSEGEEIHLGLAGSLLRDEDGSSTGYVVIFQDVTRVVELEETVRLQDRLSALGSFATDIAHEVRNPLAAISGSLELLRSNLSDEDSDDEQRSLMDIVLRETDRLSSLISDFLEYARPSKTRPEFVSVHGAVDEVAQLVQGASPSDIEFTSDIPEDLLILVDKAQLRQVLWNFVVNAQQAMPDGGKLHVAACRVENSDSQEPSAEIRNESGKACDGVENWVRITVSDTGVGIDPEAQKQIFDPFFTTKATGSGLGLATVHRIIEANDGKVIVRSDLGKGTEFEIFFAEAPGGVYS